MGVEGSGAINHSLPREGPPLPGLRAVERVSQPRMPVPASGSAVLRERSLPGAACALEPWVPRLRVAPVLFAYPAGAARKRLQPGGAWLGKVETPGGVQLPKAPPDPAALEQKGGRGSALLPENLANFGQILPTGARALAGLGLSPGTFPFTL